MKRAFISGKPKMVLSLLMLVILGLISAGCGGGGGSTDNKAANQGAGNPIVIGAPLPTGFLYGWDAERAMTVAVEEINARGGVNVGGKKRPLKLEVVDTRDLEPSVPVSDALLAVEKLILEKKADFIVGGPARSEAALAAMDLVASNKKVFISTTGFLSPKFEEQVAANYNKYKYSFRITGSSKTMVAEMLAVFDFLKNQQGFSKVAIMVQDVAHARSGGEIMAAKLKEKGWQVMDPEVYPTGTGDYSTGLLKASKFGAQVLFLWMDMPESSILLKQYADMKLPAVTYGFINSAEQPGFFKAAEGKGEYTLVHLVNAGNAPVKATASTMNFVNAYQKRWNIEPEGYGTSSSYQAIITLAAAIEKAQSTETDAVIKALEEIDMEGVYGRVRFNKEHQIIPSLDPAEGAVPQVIQWQAGKRETVFPVKIATAELKLPPWMKK
ncbi:MAG: ABC transporter substrate-binding protein [Peptococcaceae bacterium]|nr:ABC transporter substrate-binding protein [Peptococcaceae bacterium]